MRNNKNFLFFLFSDTMKMDLTLTVTKVVMVVSRLKPNPPTEK